MKTQLRTSQRDIINDHLDTQLQTNQIKQLRGMQKENEVFLPIVEAKQETHQKIRQNSVIINQPLKSLENFIEINYRELMLRMSEGEKSKEDVFEKLDERSEKLENSNQSHESSQSQVRNQSIFEAELGNALTRDIADQNGHSNVISKLNSGDLSDSVLIQNIQISLSNATDKLLSEPNHNNLSMQQLNSSQERNDQQSIIATSLKKDQDLSEMNQQKIYLIKEQKIIESQHQSGYLVDSGNSQIIDPSGSLSDRNNTFHLQQNLIGKKIGEEDKRNDTMILSHLNGNDLSNKKQEIHNQIHSNQINQQRKTDHSAIDQFNDYENKLIIDSGDVIERFLLGLSMNTIISQQKSLQKESVDQLKRFLQRENIPAINDQRKTKEQQYYRKHLIFSMLTKLPSTYPWVIKLEQKKYQLNFTFYDDKKDQYGKFNDQLNNLLQKYLENQHLLRQFFQVKKITLTKKVRLSQRIKLMNINWTNLQQLIIHDDNNWCGWLENFQFLTPVFQIDTFNLNKVEFYAVQNLKKVELHLDFLFPQCIEFLAKSSFNFNLEIYIKHMTQETYLMLKKTKFINPDKINIIFKLNKLQIEQLIRLGNYNGQQNFNLQILQSIDLQNVCFFDVLMQLNMKTFYDKCDCIKREYLSSLQLAQNLVEIWDVQIQNISLQDRLKQIYKLNQNDLFELQILRKMKSQLIFIKFEWKEVYKITLSNVISQDNEWPLFYQNSHNFINLIAIQFDFPHSQLKLIQSEHLKKFKKLKYLIIAEGIQCKKKYSKDQMEEKQKFEEKKNNRLKSFYKLSLKLPNVQVILQSIKVQCKNQIHIVKQLLDLLFDSQQIEKFQKWIKEILKVTLKYKELKEDEIQLIQESIQQQMNKPDAIPIEKLAILYKLFQQMMQTRLRQQS